MSHKDLVEKGPWLKFAPAVRSAEAAEQMWVELEMGNIDMICTDHCPFTKEEKAAGIDDIWEAPYGIPGDIWEAPYGIPGIDTTMRLMLNGVNQGKVSMERLVRVMCENPARLYGLYPRKGCLLPGADADILLLDMNAKDTISNDDIVSKCGWTPYDGMEAQGKVAMTILRGTVVAENGRPVGEPGYGEFVPRLGAE
ncbi:MAG: dihydroorotase family protein [Deltaproteobacteria bacterium]|nr:dihydroorotase family protein [Deltaproteobacteria bacterium]